MAAINSADDNTQLSGAEYLRLIEKQNDPPTDGPADRLRDGQIDGMTDGMTGG